MADVQGDKEAGLDDDDFPDDGPLDPEEPGEGGEPRSGGDEGEEDDVDGLASFLESEILGSSYEDPIDVSTLCLFSPFVSNLFHGWESGF